MQRVPYRMHPVLYRAKELEAAGDMNGAIALVMSARTSEPEDRELMGWHAMLLSKRGEDAAAIPLLEKLIVTTLPESRATALQMLAVCYESVGRKDDAVETARAALATDPTLIPATTTVALTLIERGQPEQALAMLERVLPNATKPKQRSSVENCIAIAKARIAAKP
jgi:Flp pilus assembly protein TadD